MAEKLAMMFGSAFVPDGHSSAITPSNRTDKVGFDLDTIGTQRQVLMMEEQDRAAYGDRINVAIWNTHVPVDHYFEGLIESGLVKMGNGDGFRIVVFRERGYIRNNSGQGFDIWCCSGNQEQDGNLITFGAIS